MAHETEDRPSAAMVGSASGWRVPGLLEVRARLALVCALSVVGVSGLGSKPWGPRAEPLDRALARYDLLLEPADAARVSGQRRAEQPQPIVFRAHRAGELADVYRADARLDEDGQIALTSEPTNLTRTSSADESAPWVIGHQALFARRVGDEVVALELLDLEGEGPAPSGMLARLQRGLTNLQQTGQWAGVGRRLYGLRNPVREVEVRVRGAVFELLLDRTQSASIDPALELAPQGAGLFDVRTHAVVVPGLLAWAVDTARELPFVGSETIAWLENKAFAWRDRAMQAYHGVRGTDHEAEVALELLVPVQTAEQVEKVQRLSVPDVDSGWPPAPLEPILVPAVAGEGKWRAIVDDPYARTLPSGQPVFYQTFLRPDPQRDFARLYLTLWDPRLVQLDIVAGTEEPVSATGEAGSGLVPREPEVLTRLVGAFNGGFQALHGEFGMMSEGRVYLPPKPWAATVAVFADGQVAMGSWPGPAERRRDYDEARAVAEIPADMVAFRQNLTSLVEGTRYNPWERWWWGAAPDQPAEQTLTQRSALCITEEGLMLYAWGDSMLPEALGRALIRARCVRAMHLDMNATHCGMELYNITRRAADEALPPSEGRVRFAGHLGGLSGYTVRARRAVASMATAVPRYIKADPRDYFYLSLKPGLLTSQLSADDAELETRDLPHAGWPPALARAREGAAIAVRIDPRRAPPQRDDEGSTEQQVLAELRGATLDEGDEALFATPGRYGARYRVGVPPAGAQVLMAGAKLDRRPEAEAALGVDRDGLLMYVELPHAAAGSLAKLLSRFGVEEALALPRTARLGLHFQEGVLAVDGETRLRPGPVALRFVAASRPAAEVLFPDTAPLPYVRWAALQDKRVRYFRTSEPTAKAPGAATATSP